jgi:Holliday junction resolvase
VNSYSKGRLFEYRVRDHFTQQGYFVVRAAKSAFPDLIALRRGEILLIECRVRGNLTKAEKERLIAYAKKTGGRPILAYREGRKLRLSPLDEPI